MRDMFVDVTFFPYRSDTTTTAVSLPEDLGQEGHHGGQARQRGGDGGANVVVWEKDAGCNGKTRFSPATKNQITPKNFFLRLFFRDD